METNDKEMQTFIDGFIAGISEYFTLDDEDIQKHREQAENLFKQRQLQNK